MSLSACPVLLPQVISSAFISILGLPPVIPPPFQARVPGVSISLFSFDSLTLAGPSIVHDLVLVKMYATR